MVLAEAHEQARRDFAKSLLGALVCLLVGVAIISLALPLLKMGWHPNLFAPKDDDRVMTVEWISLWAVTIPLLACLGHAYVSWCHTLEARHLARVASDDG